MPDRHYQDNYYDYPSRYYNVLPETTRMPTRRFGGYEAEGDDYDGYRRSSPLRKDPRQQPRQVERLSDQQARAREERERQDKRAAEKRIRDR